MKRMFVLIALLCLLLCDRYSCLEAQWSRDPMENTLVSTCLSTNWNPHVVSDGDGGAIVVWGEGYSGNILAQRIDSQGYVRWGTGCVSVFDGGTEAAGPLVYNDGEGGAFITWADLRRASIVFPWVDSTDVYIQRIDAEGQLQWPVDGLRICPGFWNTGAGRVVPDGEGGAIVFWDDKRSGDWETYGQRFNRDGEPLWDSLGIEILSEETIRGFVSDGSGGVIIVWDDDIRDGIYAQRVNKDGEMLWGEGGVRISSIRGGTIKVISDSASGGIISFSHSFWNGEEWIFGIYAQRVNSAGEILWLEDGILITSEADEQTFVVGMVSDDAGGVILTWADSSTGIWEYHAQRVDSIGNLLWDHKEVQGGYSTISDNNGGAVSLLSNIMNDTIFSYAQRIDGDGIEQWGTTGVLYYIQSISSSGSITETVSDGNGGIVIVRDECCWDIYAQRVDGNGNLGGWVKGDVNNDDEINILDVVFTINIILEVSEYTSAQFWAADMNDDDVVNILDAVQIVNNILTNDQ